MAHFCLMITGKEINNNFEIINKILNKYNSNNLEEKVFKKEMNYNEMLKEYNNYDGNSEYDINSFAYNIYRYMYDKESHNFGIFVNPNAKFDNFKLGGRYSVNLNVKNEEKGSFISIKNKIDMDKMKKEATEKAIEFKRFFIETLNYDENKFKENFGSEEDNILNSISDYCYPSFFYNNIWHDKSNINNKEWCIYFEEFFKNLSEEDLIILLDCHR